MNPANIVDMIKDIQERLTLDGKNKVFNEGKELRSEFMKEKAEPEAFTKEFLIGQQRHWGKGFRRGVFYEFI